MPQKPERDEGMKMNAMTTKLVILKRKFYEVGMHNIYPLSRILSRYLLEMRI